MLNHQILYNALEQDKNLMKKASYCAPLANKLNFSLKILSSTRASPAQIVIKNSRVELQISSKRIKSVCDVKTLHALEVTVCCFLPQDHVNKQVLDFFFQ